MFCQFHRLRPRNRKSRAYGFHPLLKNSDTNAYIKKTESPSTNPAAMIIKYYLNIRTKN